MNPNAVDLLWFLYLMCDKNHEIEKKAPANKTFIEGQLTYRLSDGYGDPKKLHLEKLKIKIKVNHILEVLQ